MAVVLCDEVLSDMRARDSEIYGHLWHFEVGASKGSEKTGKEVDRSTSWIESRFVFQGIGTEEEEVLASKVKLSDLNLNNQTRLRFEYDYGDTSMLWLKVEKTGEMVADATGLPLVIRGVREPSQLKGKGPLIVRSQSEAEWGRRLLMASAAVGVDATQRVDARFPLFSQAIMSRQNASVTLGLSSMIASELDTTFMTILHSHSGNDTLFAPIPFPTLDELFTIGERAYGKSEEIKGVVRDGWGTLYLFPRELSAEAVRRFEAFKAESEADKWGPQCSFHRLAAGEATVASAAVPLSTMFPRTSEQLASGRFRWIRYTAASNTLEVVAGRAKLEDRRMARDQGVCATWVGPWSSLHELLCAVEVSWVSPRDGKTPMTMDPLPVIDKDAGQPEGQRRKKNKVDHRRGQGE